jgi:hypothetical protein
VRRHASIVDFQIHIGTFIQQEPHGSYAALA